MPESPANQRRVDRDGVTRVEKRRAGGGTWILGVAIAVLCACLILSAWLTFSPDGGEHPAPGPAPRVSSRPPPSADPSPRVSSAARPPLATQSPGQPAGRPVAPEPTETPEAPAEEPPPPDGAETGLALFHFGIKPIKKGIVVPDDFPLPPGYVRHYQTTDDGKQLPAILMFHPDFKPVDASGNPVKVPENRVVPPELAPPGLPIKMLEVPGPSESAP